MESLVNALCRAFPPCPGGEPVLHLFSALPQSWDATIKLPAAYGYHVEASRKNGHIGHINLTTSSDMSLTVYNPWHSAEVLVDYGDRQEKVQGEKFQVKSQLPKF